MILSFILGLGVAALSFGGIMLGVKVLMSLNSSLSKRAYRWRLFFAIFLFFAQLALAGAALYFSDLKNRNTLMVGLGLVVGIFSLYGVIKSLEK
jgi:hypothetical protein